MTAPAGQAEITAADQARVLIAANACRLATPAAAAAGVSRQAVSIWPRGW